MPWKFFALLALPWLVWAERARERWGSDVEFYYGWAVLPMAGYLFWLRWSERPAPEIVSGAGRAWAGAVAVAGAVVLGAAGWILVPNPVWTALLWAGGLGALATTLAVLWRAGGTRWLQWFWCPLAFALSALPWPAFIQVPLLTALKAANATVTAEIVSLLGHPAVAMGSVIEVGRGVVGVEDACSGLRALQAVAMTGLFFGEIARFSIARRLALLLGGLALALVANGARTIFLTWQMARSGASSVDAWHDRAGGLELVVALAGVVALWLYLDRRYTAVAAKKAKRETAPHERPAAIERPAVAPLPLPRQAALATALALIYASAWIGTAWWYGSIGSGNDSGGGIGGGGGSITPVRWGLIAPPAGWQPYELEPVSRDLLRCDAAEGLTTAGTDENGRAWIVLHLDWDRDPALRYLASLHSPDVCLPNTGARLDAVLGLHHVEAGGARFTLQAMRFTARERTMHVFHGLWDATRGRALTPAENAAVNFNAERWRLVRERRRSLALSQLTVVVQGCRSDEEALAVLREQMPRLIVRRTAP